MNQFRKSRRKTKTTFTKLWVDRCMWFSWIGIFWCFVLASLDKVQVAENLAVAIVVNIVGVMSGYFIKSFLETKEEKRLEFEKEQFNATENIPTDFTINSDVYFNDEDTNI